MASGNLIKNYPLTTSEIGNACAIFGPDLASIRGKIVQRTPALLVADYVAVPHLLVENSKVITMVADVFFIDGIAFHLTVSSLLHSISLGNWQES
jgi:hypothetical protein